MEDFLADIYKKSIIIQYFRQAIMGAVSRDQIMKRDGWSCGAALLEEWLTDLKAEEPEAYDRIFECASLARDQFAYDILFGEILEKELLPEIERCIQPYTGIDVTEDEWRLTSAKTGFLTMSSTVSGKYMHSPTDPMWEAWLQANRFFDAKQKKYAIFGGGLGYLAYQLWSVSRHTADIYFYAPDIRLCSYAKKFGVLDWISPESLHYIIDESPENVVQRFITETDDMERIMAEDVNEYYQGRYAEDLKYMAMNNRLAGEHKKTCVINASQNKNKGNSLEKIKSHVYAKEWIVIGAGPSLRENLEFIKESCGKKTIIAISAAVKLLISEGIRCDFAAVADPFEMLLKHISGIEDKLKDIALISDIASNAAFVSKYKGPVYYVSNKADKEKYGINEETAELQYGGTVSSLALAAAYYLGAEKIYLVGVDLGYPGGKHYAAGGVYDEDDGRTGSHEVPANDGGVVGTTDTFDGFRHSIEMQIAQHSDVTVVNLAKHGALIKGCVKE